MLGDIFTQRLQNAATLPQSLITLWEHDINNEGKFFENRVLNLSARWAPPIMLQSGAIKDLAFVIVIHKHE